MIPNNVVSVLPFYKSLNKQNHRKDYAFGEVFNLITPTQTILPFQIIRDTRGNLASQITLVIKNINDVPVMSIPFGLDVTGLMINRYPNLGFDVIKYLSTGPIEIIEPLIGQHYIELNDGTETFYSEVFTYVDSIDNMLCIEYNDTESVEISGGLIDFMDNFKFRVYLDTQLGRPDYEFEEEVTKKDGYNFVEKQISEKTFKFNFLAPEYLCDALRIIRMTDNIKITNRGDVYNADTFLMSPKWQDGGFVAAVDAEFQCDTVIKKTGARFIPADNTDPNANVLKMYIGQVVDAEPTEVAIRALTELDAQKQNTEITEFLELGKRFCFAYPASYGDLTEAYVLQGFNVLSVFDKRVVNFTFGENIVPMNVYTYSSPVTYLTTPPTQQTMHYSFTQPIINQQVGDFYGGGIVIYLFQPGDQGYVEGETHGIIAAPYDTPASGGAKWSKSYLGLTGALDTAIGEGKSNTENIVLSLGAPLPPYYAAYHAHVLAIGNYHDWFLPSKDEVNILTNAARNNIIQLDYYYYWTSSEVDASHAWYFTTEAPAGFVSELKTKGTLDTGIQINVRAIRNF